MSGGSDDTARPIGGGDGPAYGAGGTECGTLIFEAPVMSPDPAVAHIVTIGTVCEVLLTGSPPQLRLYLRLQGPLLGAITEHWADVTGCIGTGFAYEAAIIQVSPVIRVRVRPRGPHTLTFPMTVELKDIPSDVTLQAGDRHHVGVTSTDQVVVRDHTGAEVGSIVAEPVSLPETLRRGTRLSATVVDAASTLVVLDHV